MEFLSKLKMRPEEERRAIALAFSILTVLVLAAFWAVTLYFKDSLTFKNSNEQQKRQAASSFKAFEDIWNDTANSLQAIGGSVKNSPTKILNDVLQNPAVKIDDQEIEKATENLIRLQLQENGEVKILEKDNNVIK